MQEPKNLENLKYNNKITIATGQSRYDVKWKNQELYWSELLQRLSQVTRTRESQEEYHRMTKNQQGRAKDVGGFVGAVLKNGRRKSNSVGWRHLITLDADYAGRDMPEKVRNLCAYAYCLYSTHSHTPEKPRLRLIIPLERPVSPEEYVAISRRVAADVDIDVFDDSTYEPHRLMYWPSCPLDAEFLFDFEDRKWLDPDAILARYEDWSDPTQWPESSRVQNKRKKLADKQGDPHEKTGVVGAFCRTYSVEDVIEKFLADVYEPCGEGRYTYKAGSTAGGLVVYDDGKFAYSHHGTDPIGGQLVNAFDLVRVQKFSGLDEDVKLNTPTSKLPSYLEMMQFCLNDDEVKITLGEDRMAAAQDDFSGTSDDWLKKLEYKQSGELKDSLSNIVLILENDPNLQGIYFNSFKNAMEAGDMPWEREAVAWDDGDSAHLEVYLNVTYRIYAPAKVHTALLSVAKTKSRNPIKEYLEGLPEWDGEERVDSLLIDLLGAKDSEYVKAVTRKTLVAAVARVYEPGIKFDQMLVLVGPQGVGKSTFFRKLGGRWFDDSLSIMDMKDKTAAEKLQGNWIIEVSELAGMRRMDVEVIKSFISRQADNFRPAYGRFSKEHPRQNVIVGSTNQEAGFLRDTTGNRRFWPVAVPGGAPGFDPFSLSKQTVDQIWAEAVHLYAAGEKLFLNTKLEQEAKEMQTWALESDDREGLVEQFLEMPLPENWDSRSLADRRHYIHGTDLGAEPRGTVSRTKVARIEIWCELFQGEKKDYSQKEATEISTILEKIGGWKQKGRERIPIYGRQRIYEKTRDEVRDEVRDRLNPVL